MTSAAAQPETRDPATEMVDAISLVGLSETAVDLLQAVRSGVDVWEDADARACRALERLGLVLIHPAVLIQSLVSRQPFFLCIISNAGKVVLGRALQRRRIRLAQTHRRNNG